MWLVWDSVAETADDARRIDAPDCVSAAEIWARRDGMADAANIRGHIDNGCDLCARREGAARIFRVHVRAEEHVEYFGRAVEQELVGGGAS